MYALAPVLSRGDTIDFDSQGQFGPSTFLAAGPAQTISVTTSVGVVTFQNGAILTGEAANNLDTTSVYATASDLGMGYTNTITITFPMSVTNFSLLVGNGEPLAVAYTVSDNSGHSQSLLTPFNTVWQPSFTVAGPIISIQATPTAPPHVSGAWDFWIDEISFDSVQEPSSMALLVIGLGGLALVTRGGQV